jgi:hypothetical protein
MFRKIILSAIFFLIIIFKSNAQFGLSQEIGVIAGPIFFQSDYGQRFNLETNFGNNGFGAGLVHYLNFTFKASCNCYRPDTYFNDHFKVRTELSMNKSNFEHFGKWVEGKPSIGKTQLKAMRGTSNVTNIGAQLEFFPLSLRRFSSDVGSIAPFGSIGAQYSFFNSKSYSLIGKVDDPFVTPTKYLGASRTESSSVLSIVSSAGMRYKLTEMSDLMLDLRWQYYFSNWVDGLNPDPKLYPENRSNDWLFWVNVGYIIYIE